MINEVHVIDRLKEALSPDIFNALMVIYAGKFKYSTNLIFLEELLLKEDPHTYAHVQRVARGAVQIAKYMQCPERLLPAIYRLGFHHDDGKLAILQTVTLNPLKLTPEQRNRYLPVHTIAGAQMACSLSLPGYHRVVNLAHHMDTKKYPDFSQTVEAKCFADWELDIISDFFFQTQGGKRMNEIICTPDSTLVYKDLEIGEDNLELWQFLFGLYASQLVTAADGPDALLFPRPYHLADIGPDAVLEPTDERRAMAWDDLNLSGLPGNVKYAAQKWIKNAEHSLVEKSIDKYAIVA